MRRLKSTNFCQNKPKIKLFLQKNKIFRVLGGLRLQTLNGLRPMGVEQPDF